MVERVVARLHLTGRALAASSHEEPKEKYSDFLAADTGEVEADLNQEKLFVLKLYQSGAKKPGQHGKLRCEDGRVYAHLEFDEFEKRHLHFYY